MARRLRRRIKNTAIYCLLRGLLALIQLLPTGVVRGLGRALGWLAGWIPAPERRRAASNLARVWPKMAPGDRRRLLRRVYANLGQLAAEGALARRLTTTDSWPNAVQFDQRALALLQQSVGEGRGVVFVTAHYGSWELLAAALARFAPLSVLAKRSYDARLDALVSHWRGKSGIETIWVQQPNHLKRAARRIRSGAIVGILIDQPIEGAPRLPFLGRPASTNLAPAILARATKAPLLVGFIEQLSIGVHRVALQRIEGTRISAGRRTALQTAQSLNDCVEAQILAEPGQWAWTLDRWR